MLESTSVVRVSNMRIDEKHFGPLQEGNRKVQPTYASGSAATCLALKLTLASGGSVRQSNSLTPTLTYHPAILGLEFGRLVLYYSFRPSAVVPQWRQPLNHLLVSL
jgi:hypothetical protein